VSNQVCLALFVMAYNPNNFMRRFALQRELFIIHPRMTVFQMAEVTVTERPESWYDVGVGGGTWGISDNGDSGGLKWRTSD
jgi:hypothetical protein